LAKKCFPYNNRRMQYTCYATHRPAAIGPAYRSHATKAKEAKQKIGREAKRKNTIKNDKPCQQFSA